MLGSRRTKDFQAISGCMLLQNCGGKLREVVKLAVPVTLADHEKFQDKFLNNLSFPERS